MNKTKYNQLREEIILAVPEIMEWQDGVLVQFEWYGSFTDEGGSEHFDEEPSEFRVGIILGDKILGYEYGEDLERKDFKNGIYKYEEGNVWEYIGGEILGRDITLEDVMIAIEGKHLIAEISVRVDGTFYKHQTAEILGRWKPNIPLQDQSDECKELLYQLIVKK